MTKEELKKEAEEKCVCTDEAMRIMYGIGYIDGAEPREKRITELEKENAELRSGCGMCYSKDKDLLTKAKEHIENLLYYIQQCTCERSNYAEMDEDIKQASQFIKEIEK